MVLTKQRSHRDPEKFPTVQLFLLGESLPVYYHNMADVTPVL
jgi:hypothetical protein